MIYRSLWRGAIFAVTLFIGANSSSAKESNKPCTEDAMIVFDASGSMAGSLAEVGANSSSAKESNKPCTEDAMIVFDASGSMAGSLAEGMSSSIRRIDEVRKALAKVLPNAARFRRIGLITYGPGPEQQCNVDLKLRPQSNAAKLIMEIVDSLNPAGKTPLAKAVEQAAEVLDFKTKPGTIVVLTDGEETCGGTPCDLGKM